MKRTNQQTLIMTQLTLHSSSWESMTSRWEILTAEFRIQALAHRTVKANPKPGGLEAEWHRASLGRIESTSHIPDTFIVCARATDCESLYVWARGRNAARQFMGGNEKRFQIKKAIFETDWLEEIPNKPLPVTSMQISWLHYVCRSGHVCVCDADE